MKIKEVTRGAKFLDEVIPGWYLKIDLGTLNLALGSQCVLGQLCPRELLDQTSPYDALRTKLNLSHQDTVNLGFNIGSAIGLPESHSFYQLMEAWTEEVKDRCSR